MHVDPAPPTFSAVFGIEPTACHRSGSPPFRFVAELTYSPSPDNEQRPITVCTQRTAFGTFLPFGGGLNSVEQLVYCVDAETGEEPDWPCQFQCFDSDPWGPFPSDDQFVEVLPGRTWRFEYTLDRESDSMLGSLEQLEKGRKYRAELSMEAKRGFVRWMYGSKEGLLRGTVEERKKRWDPGLRGIGSIQIEQVNKPVLFDVVD